MSEPDNGNIALTTFVTIIILFGSIFILPLIAYGYAWWYKVDAAESALRNKEIDKYNELSDMYLFCSYMPFKKLLICKAGISDTESVSYLEKVSTILDILKGKKEIIENKYEKIKTLSDGFINDNKVSRIKREFEEEQRLKKEAGEDGRLRSNLIFLWITSILSGLKNIVNIVIEIFKGGFGIIIPLIAALAKNRVVTGFLIIILVIIILLSIFKSKSESSKKGGGANTASGSNAGLSPTAIYNDLLDTYRYYSTMVKDLNTNMDFLGISTANELNENDEDYNETINRKILVGKRYDNLSYIQLSSLDQTIQTEIKKIYNIDIETGKYYNIYLPSEKFNILQSDIKWKTSNNANNEKIWDIDCEAIGKQGSKEINAFISNEGKCIINEAELKNADKPSDAPKVPPIYKTEYIK